jgi:hypothetical protein
LCFLRPDYEHDHKIKRIKTPKKRVEELLKFVTNPNGKVMEAVDQLDLFCNIASNNGRKIACHFFEENTKYPVWKNTLSSITAVKIAVIRFQNEKYVASSNKVIFGFNIDKLSRKLELTKCNRVNVYSVPDKVSEEFHPLMAAFMSYTLLTRKKNGSKSICNAELMLRYLVYFLGYSQEQRKSNPCKKYTSEFYNFEIRDYVRKDDNTIMNFMEQFEFFAKIANEKGWKVDIFLYREGNSRPIAKSHQNKYPECILPVVKLVNGRFAAAAMNNSQVFDIKNCLLRTVTKSVLKKC